MSFCLKCGSSKSAVVDSRIYSKKMIRRKRKCECGEKYSTLEIPVSHHPRAQEVAEWAADEAVRIYLGIDDAK